MMGGPPSPDFDFGGRGGHPPPRFGPRATDKTRFFRGVQLTDREGVAHFATIYPGWYLGRDTHIHMKVHTQGSASKGIHRGGNVCHTGQLFFPDEISDAVARLSPYSSHKAERTRQEDDDMFSSQHGSEFLLALKQTNSRSMSEGFTAAIVVGVDPRPNS
jgi:protocatechuate 3,4-dioxygenase beta subunit